MPPCHCTSGWICEAHPDQPWPHDDCAGPGEQCHNPACPWWQGSAPAALSTVGWDRVYASTGMPDDVRVDRHRMDHPGSTTCPRCQRDVPLPNDEPWLVIGGVATPPQCMESFRCPHCRGRIYCV